MAWHAWRKSRAVALADEGAPGTVPPPPRESQRTLDDLALGIRDGMVRLEIPVGGGAWMTLDLPEGTAREFARRIVEQSDILERRRAVL